MSGRPRIVLYNPRADFHTLPLALLAVASAVDRRQFAVQIVDGRLEADPVAAVLDAVDGALCLGVTALTGAPLRDALRVTRAVKARFPHCPVIWGGWHPSLFPVETLREAGVDATVQGQGERVLAAVADRLTAGVPLAGLPGCTTTSPDGAIATTPARPPEDVNRFPAVDYSLVPVEAYFARKRQRQVDYVSSQGCRFRCGFCADPTVYGRSWSGLDPERVGEELAALVRAYGATDVAFQDETFFTHASRVTGIADQLLRRDVRVTWMATMRADQGARLPLDVFTQCRRAGLRRVMVGLESGSQPMLDWMQKDAQVEQAFTLADKCRATGIAVLCNLIVGFPGESDESVAATLNVAKRLRRMGPQFQIAVFYYRPYPGTAITEGLARAGVPLPASLDAWAAIDDPAYTSPWVDAKKRAFVDGFTFYQRIAWAESSVWRAPLQAIARWRCARDWYRWPVERRVLTTVRTFGPQG